MACCCMLHGRNRDIERKALTRISQTRAAPVDALTAAVVSSASIHEEMRQQRGDWQVQAEGAQGAQFVVPPLPDKTPPSPDRACRNWGLQHTSPKAVALLTLKLATAHGEKQVVSITILHCVPSCDWLTGGLAPHGDAHAYRTLRCEKRPGGALCSIRSTPSEVW